MEKKVPSCGVAHVLRKTVKVDIPVCFAAVLPTAECNIHSSYLGPVNINAHVSGDKVTLDTEVKGMLGYPNIRVKVIDAQEYGLDPLTYTYDGQQLASLPAVTLSISKCRESAILAKTADKKTKHKCYLQTNAVDIFHNTCNYIEFLHKYLQRNNVTDDAFLVSICNVKMDNAFWSGEYMVYGTGDSMFYPLGTIDIGGHEASHGLIQSIAGLEYRGHSGAINESYADIIGTCFEFYMYKKIKTLYGESDWVVGESSGKQVNYLRNMSDPNDAAFPQPKIYQGKYWADPNDMIVDLGGVHINSGVGNYCFYLMSQKMGWERSLSIFWTCLKRLPSTATYVDFRNTIAQITASSQKNCVDFILEDIGLDKNIKSDWDI